MKTVAKVFTVLGMIVGCWTIVPIIIGILALKQLSAPTTQSEWKAISILNLLFCNTIAGILMLCMSENEIGIPPASASQEVVKPTIPKAANVLSIIGFVAGVLAVVLGCCTPDLQFVFAIVGLILSAIGMKKAKNAGFTSVFGIIGLILSILGVVFGGVSVLLDFVVGGINVLTYITATLSEMFASY